MVKTGEVNGVRVNVVRDTGCGIVGVRESLLEKGCLTNETVACILFDGDRKVYKVGYIHVKSEYFTGWTKAALLKNPPVDLIIGNIKGSTMGRGKNDMGSFRVDRVCHRCGVRGGRDEYIGERTGYLAGDCSTWPCGGARRDHYHGAHKRERDNYVYTRVNRETRRKQKRIRQQEYNTKKTIRTS